MVKKIEHDISSEEEIAMVQIERIKDISRSRLLTTDEVKMYDLLVKNLRLLKEESNAINTTYVKIQPKNETELLEIAALPPELKKDE